MILRLHGHAGHVAHRSVTLSAIPSNSKISTRKHEKYTVSIVKRSYDKTYYNTSYNDIARVHGCACTSVAFPRLSVGPVALPSRAIRHGHVPPRLRRRYSFFFSVFFLMCVHRSNEMTAKNTRFPSSP